VKRLQFHPASRFHALCNGAEGGLIWQTIFEGWLNCFAFNYGFNKVGDWVGERVFLTNDVTGRHIPSCFQRGSVVADLS
jgi:hypothetical protein